MPEDSQVQVRQKRIPHHEMTIPDLVEEIDRLLLRYRSVTEKIEHEDDRKKLQELYDARSSVSFWHAAAVNELAKRAQGATPQ
jgi:hypothetical protein